MKVFMVLLMSFTVSLSQQQNYDRYKVYSVFINDTNKFNILSKYKQHDTVDFWTPLYRFGTVDIMVPAFEQKYTESLLSYHKFQYTVKIKDVGRMLYKERSLQKAATRMLNFCFENYYRYSDILAYVQELAKNYKDIVSVQNIGKSTENRDLVVVKISSGGSKNKPAILIDGGIHAREWISPAQVLYIIQELVENKNNSNLIKNVDWHIIPVLNPDGYEYSHTTDRMWRKTRSKGILCQGVDANRNFDVHWGEAGTSPFDCSNEYRGPSAFSEPETRALRDYVLKNPKKFKLYLTFHSYGQYLLYPWSYASVLPENSEELQSLGETVARAIQSTGGTKYQVGSSTSFMGATAGSSDDWVMGGGNVSLSYTIELPGGGSQGFDLPPNRIFPVVKETFEGIKVFHRYVEKM